MTFTFRPAKRENVNLLVFLAGGTGSGKTYTAMRLAKGMAGDKPFCVIDTEAGRAKHYAGMFTFDHGDFEPPFTPARYTEAIRAADREGYPVIILDSGSHEHAGEGGMLDMQEAEFQRMGGRNQVKPASWIMPKKEHKKYVQTLLQIRAHLIICLRAEPKIDIVKDEKGDTKIVPKQSLIGYNGWLPVCEKNFPFEATASFMFMPDAPGVPHPIKLQEQHKAFFPLDKPITEESGKALAAWAAGGGEMHGFNSARITMNQALDLETMCRDHKIPIENLLRAAKVGGTDDILATDFERALSWVNAAIAKRTTGEQT